MSLFRTLLPACFVIFIIWKSYNNRLFLLGIPFLQVMGISIFIDSLFIFTYPHKLPASVIILGWVFLAWFLSVGFLDSEKRNNLKWRDFFGPPLIMPEEGLLIILVVVWLFNFVFSLFNAVDFNGVFATGIDLGCMFLGYLLVRGIINNATGQEIDKFLVAIILINSIAAILYILNQGFHFPIYEGDQYQTVNYMDTVITRTFWWMPRYYFLSLAYVISRSKLNLISIAIFIITLTSAFFSYTRNTFIIYGAMISLALILPLFKKRILSSLLRLVGLVAIGGVLFWSISFFFQSELVYLTERFQEMQLSQSITDVSDFSIRMNDFNQTYVMLQKDNLFTGLGMATEVTRPEIMYFNQWTADITWVGIMYRYGIIGVILFSALFITFGIRSLRGYFQTQSPVEEEYWLMFLLIVVATFAETFVSWTIFDDRNMTLSLWFFAFIAVMANKKFIPKISNISL